MKHRNISADSLAHEFRLLRNRIESATVAPALVFVTSATDEDGTGFAAQGIAASLSRTHQRTVLITTDATLAPPSSGEMVGGLRRRASDRVDSAQLAASSSSGFSVVCLSPERVSTISRTRVAEMVQELRASNDYVVVDGGNLAENGLGLLLVSSADIAVVAFRAGRSEQPADRLMMDALERAESKVIGVVMTDQESLEHFAQSKASAENPADVAVERELVERKPAMLRRLEVVLNRLVRSS
jgi:Mrp family chromosome partitioning ATPase